MNNREFLNRVLTMTGHSAPEVAARMVCRCMDGDWENEVPPGAVEMVADLEGPHGAEVAEMVVRSILGIMIERMGAKNRRKLLEFMGSASRGLN